MVDRNFVYSMYEHFCEIRETAEKNSLISNLKEQKDERKKWWSEINNYNNKLKRMSVENESALYSLINFELKKKIFNINQNDIQNFIKENNISSEDCDPLNSYWKSEEIIFRIKNS